MILQPMTKKLKILYKIVLLTLNMIKEDRLIKDKTTMSP